MVAVKSKSWHFIREDFLSANVSRLKRRRLKESQIEIRENEKIEKLPIQKRTRPIEPTRRTEGIFTACLSRSKADSRC